MSRVFWLFLVCSFKCFKMNMHRGLSQLFRGLQSFLYAFVRGASSVIDLILSQSYAKSQNDQYAQASHIDTLRVLSHIPSLCHAFLLFITHSSPSSFIPSLRHTFIPIPQVHGEGTWDEFLRMSAWDAMNNTDDCMFLSLFVTHLLGKLITRAATALHGDWKALW